MNCRKCGAEIADGEKLCKNCGEPADENLHMENNTESSTENSTKDDTEISANPPKEKPDRKRLFIVCFFAAVLLFIIFMSTVGKYPLLYAFSPKIYTLSAVGNTLTEIYEEKSDKIVPSVFDVNLKEYTLSADGKFGTDEFSFAMSSSRKSGELFARFNYLKNSQNVMSYSLFADNASIGLNSGDSDEYLTLPAKLSKEEWNSSALRQALKLDETDKDIDLSFSTLSKGFYNPKTIQKLMNLTSDFASDLKLKTKENDIMTLDGRETKVRKLTFTASGADTMKYVSDMLARIQKDDVLNDAVKEKAAELQASFNEQTSIDEITVSIYCRSKYAVGIQASVPVSTEKSNYTIELSASAVKTKDIADNIVLGLSVSDGDSVSAVSVSKDSEHSDKSSVYSYNTAVNITGKKPLNLASSYSYDTDDNSINGNIYLYENEDCTKIDYSGTLTDKDGYNLNLTDISSDDEKLNGSFSLSIIHKAEEKKPESITEKAVLDMTAEEISAALKNFIIQ